MRFDEINKKEMGLRIRRRREMLNLTREDLGRELSVTEKFISDVEYGNKGISVNTLYKLRQVLNISANYILAGDETNIDEDQKHRMLSENILGLLSVCSVEQLRYMENIIRLYIRGVVEDENDSER